MMRSVLHWCSRCFIWMFGVFKCIRIPNLELILFTFGIALMLCWNLYLSLKTPAHIFEITNNSPSLLVLHEPLEFIDKQLKFIIDEKETCRERIFLLITIHSAVKNQQLRDFIRKTWGFSRTILDAKIVKLFFVGLPTNSSWQDKLTAEADEYHDIIQGNFLDVYRHLTMKHMILYKWIDRNCRYKVSFILKTDDDVVISVTRLVRYLMKPIVPQESVYLCYIMKNPIVFREGKYNLSYERFPAAAFPDFCSGTAYVMTADVPATVLQHSRSIPISKDFFLDDTYLTGMVRFKAGIRLLRINGQFSSRAFTMFDKKPWVRFEDFANNPELIFAITQWVENPFQTMQRIWNLIAEYELMPKFLIS